MLKSIPIPTAGVMLGLAALGNLLAPYLPFTKGICGILSAFLGLLLLLRLCKHPQSIRQDMTGNPIMASVSATFFMSIMQLATYIKDWIPFAAEWIWIGAVFCHALLILWFTHYFVVNLQLKHVFPTFFITYVGIVVGSVTAPAFGYLWLGNVIFWFGFVLYMLMLVLVTYRYYCLPVAEPAKPLLCIYTAPMSLSLAGYFAVVPEKSFFLILVMEMAAQALYFFVLCKLPKLLRLPFYPSYAAFTFPFVITATALKQTITYLDSLGYPIPALLSLFYIEMIFSTLIVGYVTIRYFHYFYQTWTSLYRKNTEERSTLPA